MRCPACGDMEDKVLETRTTNSGSAMRRRRVCLKCGYRFTSYERVEDKPIVVIKKNGDLQNFDITKIERGIRMCTDKRNISAETIENLIADVEEAIKIQAGSKHEITSSAIGEETLKQLYKVDKVAYIRFASVYRAFDNVEQFIKEIESLAQKAEA
ncbi:MAG TPA: transcriptional regulator NrdR [Sphaerochaeta sp.]|jgi:transcriptional repressor NrdR|nr:transcriptional regulator NrdR [Sphaerochaeta sp.]